jgi:hypothetical protein
VVIMIVPLSFMVLCRGTCMLGSMTPFVDEAEMFVTGPTLVAARSKM